MSDTFVQSEVADEIKVTQEITEGAVDPNPAAPDSTDTLPSEKTEAPSVPEKFLKEDGSVDQDALLKSYLELEKGKSSEEASEGEASESEEQTDENAAADLKGQEEKVNSIVEEAGFSMDDLSAQVDEHGDLTDEQYAKFEEMGYPEEMARMYVRGLQTSAKDAADLKAAGYEAAGGEEEYQSMIEWAAENLTDAEIDAYDDAVNSLDKARTMKAIETLKAKYAMHGEKEPDLTVNGEGGDKADVYTSEAEYMEDMMDPRYDTSEAYRDKVIAKRLRSNF